ncbi:MAG: AI-2E family transporter [Zetaproteobacteria bacterium]|nr:MAG: AI-2E family transporter [Zetaproteobacteria bacterium]
MRSLLGWLKDHQARDAELVMLLLSLLGIFLLLLLFGGMLAPLLLAIALAYVLDGVVGMFERCGVPHLLAVALTMLLALLACVFALLAVVPLLVEQVGQLVANTPHYVQAVRDTVHQVQSRYAEWLPAHYLQDAMSAMVGKLQEWGAALLSLSISSIPGAISLLVYAVLVPVLVFFLLKDKARILAWSQQFLPRQRTLLDRVWHELDAQIGNYIRGKFWEAVIVALAMWICYAWLRHPYALLLAVLTGVSVWVPFVGAAVVTIPVVLLSMLQWGWSDALFYGLAGYTVIQTIDANLIVPWLFSEMVNLHPIAIIVAVLVFGNWFGVLGVIVAIPLAALVQSVLSIIMERREARVGD